MSATIPYADPVLSLNSRMAELRVCAAALRIMVQVILTCFSCIFVSLFLYVLDVVELELDRVKCVSLLMPVLHCPLYA